MIAWAFRLGVFESVQTTAHEIHLRRFWIKRVLLGVERVAVADAGLSGGIAAWGSWIWEEGLVFLWSWLNLRALKDGGLWRRCGARGWSFGCVEREMGAERSHDSRLHTSHLQEWTDKGAWTMGFGQWFQSAARSVGKWFQPGGIKAYAPLLEQINALESGLEKLEGDQLAGKTGELRGRLDKGEPLDALLPFAFALVREASRRELGMRHFDVQMLGGIGLHKGCVVEMKTGEGKTLVATLPAYLNALTGKGVHVVTVNDYLASRDAEWMGKIYRSLGLEVGVVLEQMAKSEAESQRRRQEAYKADITYVTNHELVFDYLRDNLATSPEELVQRGQHFAIIDEVDLLLIDEVRTPLIISGPSEENVNVFGQVDRVVRRLNAGSHYKVELKSKTATLTEEGIDQVEKGLGVGG